jgi:CBS domain-containing protein
MDLGQACWLAFGSEGRGEQTVATDQDNGLVFASEDPARDRSAWLAMAQEVNEALDACGYPLCQGRVMASNPDCCLTTAEWQHRFAQWIEQGAPEDLLKASIYFDLRPLAGNAELAAPLRLLAQYRAGPRAAFSQADGGQRIAASPAAELARGAGHPGHRWTPDAGPQAAGHGDIRRCRAAVCLAHGLPDMGTRARLEAAAPLMRVSPQEGQAWVTAFEFLQMLRLQVQIGARRWPTGNPNLVDTSRSTTSTGAC